MDLISPKMKQFGFVLEKEDKKLAFCGDVPLKESLVPRVQGSDWMLHEAFCLYEERDIFKPYEKSHSTVKDACELASQLGVKNLLLYHTEDSHLKERKKHPTWEILDSLYDKYGTQIDKFREKAYNFFNKEGMSDEEIDSLVEAYQKEVLQKDSEKTIRNVVRRGSTLNGTSDSSFSMSKQLEKQANEVAKKEIAERQAMIELFEDYLSENDITNPTEQDIYNSLDAYDVYDANESFDQEGQKKYFDTIKKNEKLN